MIKITDIVTIILYYYYYYYYGELQKVIKFNRPMDLSRVVEPQTFF